MPQPAADRTHGNPEPEPARHPDTGGSHALPHTDQDAGGEHAGLLIVSTLLAGMVIVGVLFSILGARGVGPLASASESPTPQPGEPVAAEVVEVRASSALVPLDATGPERLIDGDPTTAWNEAAPGDGSGEWVELRLAEPAAVTGLLIWNGYQKDDAFGENNRVERLGIGVGDRFFTVRLLDRRGPLSVDLPQAVRTDRVRLTVGSVYPGTRYDDTTLSEVRVLVEPA